MNPPHLNIYTDGGSRGNPGPAAIGVVIKDQNQKIIHQFGRCIGSTTNNQAEYQAVINALLYLIKKKLQPKTISFFVDSQLVASQLSGLWKIKNPQIRNLVFKVRQLEAQLQIPITYTAIPRSKNFEPDTLLNQALNQHLK